MEKIGKEIKEISTRMVEVEWIAKNGKFAPENRCNCLDENELSVKMFTTFDRDWLIKRIKSYGKHIFNVNPEWAVCCPMAIYLIEGVYYIAEGQGRFLSVLEYNETHDNKITEIPVTFYYGKTYHEMVKDILAMNSFAKNWNTSDKFRLYCIEKNDTSLYNNIRKIQDELQIKSLYIANLILFGFHNASHKDEINSNEYSKYKDTVFMCFKRFYEGTVVACNGIKSQINAIKKNDCAMALYRIISNVIRVCEDEGVPYEKVLKKCIDILIKCVNSMDRQYAFKQTFGAQQAAITSYFAQCISKKTRDEYIKQAVGRLTYAA